MLKNFWYCLGPSGSFSQKLSRVQILGQYLLVYRNGGRLIATSAVCPHQGAIIDTVTADGCLQCPYHLWKFDSSGNCVEIPPNPTVAIPKSARIDSYPACDKNGLAWVFMGDIDPSDSAPLPDFVELGDPAYRAVYNQQVWKAGFNPTVANSCDFSHAHALHFFGSSKSVVVDDLKIQNDSPWQATGTMSQYFNEPSLKLMFPSGVNSKSPVHVSSTFFFPGTVRILFKAGDYELLVYVTCTPVDQERTWFRQYVLRNFHIYPFPFLNPLFDLFTNRFALKVQGEDKQILERVQRGHFLPTYTRADALVILYQKLHQEAVERGWQVSNSGNPWISMPSIHRRENPVFADRQSKREIL